ncbi:MAG: rhodanese-like domain-containing protein [Planctomycetota bacterium]
MILERFYLGCLAHASYLIADQAAGIAAVVDPQRDIDQYLEAAERLGVQIRHVLLTHFHADFVAGDRELQERCGAEVHLGARANPDYPHHKLADGEAVEFGQVRIEAMLTPGHTPESTCFAVFDLAKDRARPHAVLTGDTLFLGDVGRPDLLGAVGFRAEDLAGMLFDSLHQKLLKLPDETLVYPAHGAGSMCGKSLGSEPFSTIGTQRRSNYALQPMSRAAFVAMLTEGQPQAPRYFLHDAVMNKTSRPLLDAALERGLVPLSLAKVLELERQGAQVVDVRDDAAVARGTLRNAFHIGLAGSFATWCGSLLKLDRPVIVLAEPGTEREAVLRMGRVGIDRVVGYLDGGAAALRERADLLQTTPQIDLAELRRRLAARPRPAVLDVRTPTEWAQGHIDGALHVPLIELQDRLAEVPDDGEVAVICRTQNRSASAVSVLRRAGRANVVHVLEGMSKWDGGGGCATGAGACGTAAKAPAAGAEAKR